jgi:hypothetical protein
MTMTINYSEGFQRVKTFVLWGLVVLGFMVVTNSRRDESIFWVSRRVVGAFAVYRGLRLIADSFSPHSPDSN